MKNLKNNKLSKTPKSLVKIIEYPDERVVFVDNEQLAIDVFEDVFKVSAVEGFNQLVRQAEQALAKKAVEQYQ